MTNLERPDRAIKQEGTPLESFRFSDVEWKPESQEGDAEIFSATGVININGENIPYQAIKTQKVVENKLLKQKFDFVFTHPTGDFMVHVFLDNEEDPELDISKDHAILRNSVRKKDGCKLKGDVFYPKIAEFLQYLTNDNNRPAYDLVERTPKAALPGDRQMTAEEWDRRFRPLLTFAGYEEMEEGKWKKEYKPNNEKS